MTWAKWIAGAIMATVASAAAAQDVPDIEMWRLDCGTIALSDSESFSDGHLYDGVPRTLTDSCYVIRNGDRYLLWDTGLPGALAGTSMTSGVYTVSVERTIADQLAEIGLTPEQMTFVGVSHYHFDHIGQASDFAGSTLLINERDFAAVEAGVDAETTAAFASWLANRDSATTFPRDHDVFGDGSVTILSTPGHTPGHSALLVRLPETGNILLSGDLYHFREQIENRGVPQFNTDRADTLASMERFLQIDQALEAIIVIQHDPGDVERLPGLPGERALMIPFTQVEGRAYPFGRANVDTDVIIPAHWLKTVSREGMGQGAFETVRKEPGNVFDNPDYAGAPVLIAGDNFGCGSSREHAAWALGDMGVRVVIAPSFSDIFSGNAFKNGILTVALSQPAIDRLMEVAKTDPITIDLEHQVVTTRFQDRFVFEIDAFRKECLLAGRDEIGLTLESAAAIGAYEARVAVERPWLSPE